MATVRKRPATAISSPPASVCRKVRVSSTARVRSSGVVIGRSTNHLRRHVFIAVNAVEATPLAPEIFWLPQQRHLDQSADTRDLTSSLHAARRCRAVEWPNSPARCNHWLPDRQNEGTFPAPGGCATVEVRLRACQQPCLPSRLASHLSYKTLAEPLNERQLSHIREFYLIKEVHISNLLVCFEGLQRLAIYQYHSVVRDEEVRMRCKALWLSPICSTIAWSNPSARNASQPSEVARRPM